MPIDAAVLESMNTLGVTFEEMDCDPDLADTASFRGRMRVPLERSANTILVASRRPEGHFAACLVLATTRLDVNGLVRQRLGVKKVSFADAGQTRELTGMEIGGVTIFGLPDALPVWVDSGCCHTTGSCSVPDRGRPRSDSIPGSSKVSTGSRSLPTSVVRFQPERRAARRMRKK